MMESTEKKEVEIKASSVPPPPLVAGPPGGDADVDAEDRERYARELKAGLHPLKV